MFRRKPAESLLPPEWMVVGLGNPGPEYRGTRHNIGFAVIDALAAKHNTALKTRKHHALYDVVTINGHSVLLVKPLTFMNLSGQAVKALAREFRIEPANIVVVTDDLDLPVGRIRMKPHGGAGGHNGHRNIIALLGTDQYPRIKFGIGKGEAGKDYVLSGFPPAEQEAVQLGIRRVIDGLEVLLSQGIERAISAINSHHDG
jgi:PTH1 family peptidyl-tRNA hydrolase